MQSLTLWKPPKCGRSAALGDRTNSRRAGNCKQARPRPAVNWTRQLQDELRTSSNRESTLGPSIPDRAGHELKSCRSVSPIRSRLQPLGAMLPASIDATLSLQPYPCIIIPVSSPYARSLHRRHSLHPRRRQRHAALGLGHKAFVELDGRTLLSQSLDLARSVTPDVRVVGDP